MSEQIDHLLDIGERPSVTVQVVPDTPEIAGALGGAFAIATEWTSDVAAYSGSVISGSVHTEPDLITRRLRRGGFAGPAAYRAEQDLAWQGFSRGGAWR